MFAKHDFKPAWVTGPRGERSTVATLPASSIDRWTARRKAEVVAAIDGGLLSVAEACEKYELTLEELTCWQRAIERSGLLGLRITRVQHYRDKYARLAPPI